MRFLVRTICTLGKRTVLVIEKATRTTGQGRLPKNRTCFWGVAIAGCHCLNGTVNGSKDIHEKCHVLKVKSSKQALPEAAP